MAARWVTKKNGDLEKFSKTKIIKGCKKSGCNAKHAQLVANKVASKSYDKISTRKVGLLVVTHLRKVNPKAAASFNRVFSRNWRSM